MACRTGRGSEQQASARGVFLCIGVIVDIFYSSGALTDSHIPDDAIFERGRDIYIGVSRLSQETA